MSWARLFVCESCAQRFRAEDSGELGRRCLCGSELLREPRDELDELLASPLSLDAQRAAIELLLRRVRGLPPI